MVNWSSRDGSNFKTYKFQDPQLNTTLGNKLAITLNLKEEQDVLLGLGLDSKFNGNGNDLGNFHYGTKISGKGAKTILLETKDFKSKGDKALEWSKISTFSVTLTDAETKHRIKLAEPEGVSLLQRIELIKP
jgi:hypothetical protein